KLNSQFYIPKHMGFLYPQAHKLALKILYYKGKWAKFGQPKMGSGRGQNQNSGTIGSKICDPTPSFERLPRRSKEGLGSQIFDPMVPLFWFWPLLEPIFGCPNLPPVRI